MYVQSESRRETMNGFDLLMLHSLQPPEVVNLLMEILGLMTWSDHLYQYLIDVSPLGKLSGKGSLSYYGNLMNQVNREYYEFLDNCQQPVPVMININITMFSFLVVERFVTYKVIYRCS